MRFIVSWWQNLLVARKLAFVVGIMAVLIAGELLTLRFSMHTLSAARAFVGGEGLWSKAQKNAVLSLQLYSQTRSEKDYEAFERFLSIPAGDHVARMALLKSEPDLEAARRGFLDGRIDPQDIDSVIDLLRRFAWVSYLRRAVHLWTQADELLGQLRAEGSSLHQILSSPDPDLGKVVEINAHVAHVKELNDELTPLEEQFSFALGDGSRWLEYVVLSLLFIAVLTVESVGLTLTYLTSRSISRGLDELNRAADKLGRGDFKTRVTVHSRDEIGMLGLAVNRMGSLLEKSYRGLEQRVEERTAELSNLARENARLYEEATTAIMVRDEFLSIASHELRTPLTSMYLQMQLLARNLRHLDLGEKGKQLEELSDGALRQTRRLTSLLDQLLDLTRLRVGKLEIKPEKCDVVAIIREVVNQLSVEAARSGSLITIHSDGPLIGMFDSTRISQVATNLVSNAIKYGDGKEIDVRVSSVDDRVVIAVKDRGVGIPPEQHGRIFERFERADADPNVSGLGLGLYITKQIVSAHGGSIYVESELGAGSTFSVELKLV
jgi:signal transduction histidine kinase